MKTSNHFFATFISKMDQGLRYLLALMMGLLVIDVTWQVLTRFVLPQPSSFTEEVARFLLIWVSLLGGAYAYRQHSHLGFDLIVRNLSVKKAIRIYQFSCLLVSFFAVAVLIVGGTNLMTLTWTLGQFSPVLNVPMAAVYSVLPLSGILFLIYSLYFLLNADQNAVTNQEESVEIIEELNPESNETKGGSRHD
ncbi:TRAP transporter small permease [Psychrosphaera sp. 1_MG-2023]|uniref:TRAP transporter small permease n=1 Tax=Psychrosphaera sp. 1_MG-2023 TaxID=3062643 RepID=UPI0026E165B0|nr:TRAP transporter small permease [Psychrosphaera sp. 1_MG-2023]MDO6719813.1 TRAP transporter small permease [Psychrosphaera sp. 1_MG-2023]